MGWDRLVEKFRGLAVPAAGEDLWERLAVAVRRLDEIPVAGLCSLLREVRGPNAFPGLAPVAARRPDVAPAPVAIEAFRRFHEAHAGSPRRPRVASDPAAAQSPAIAGLPHLRHVGPARRCDEDRPIPTPCWCPGVV